MINPPPWKIVPQPGGLFIEDMNGVAIAYLDDELNDCGTDIQANAEFIVKTANFYQEMIGEEKEIMK